MPSAFIVSERPFAFHCGPDLEGKQYKESETSWGIHIGPDLGVGGKQYKESETSWGIHIGKSDIPFVDSSIIESTALV